MNLYSINGYNVHGFESKNNFLNFINDKKCILIAINAEKILKEESQLKELVRNHIGYADGIGAVLALEQKGCENAIKIPGSEFWLDIIQNFHHEKTFYFIGSSEDVINKTIQRLELDFPDIKILGHRDGFFKNDQDFEDTCTQILKLKPDVVFVAQGSPRQEYTMQKIYSKHPALYMGLGGSFDIYSGLKKRAPKFFLDNHLEWFYRLVKEPTRLSRQVNLIKFLFLLYCRKI